MWYWLFKYIFMGPLLSLLGRPKVEGLEYVPHSGPMILASNHLAVADSFYLCLVVRRRITYLAKAGLARLALQTGVPVIPVAMIGTDVVNPPGSKMWRFGRVQVKFGKPMDFSRFEGLAGNRFIERAVIDEVMYELMRLGGQEYVDLYAADVKNGKAEITAKPSARMPEV